ncbi:MAG: 50S ribosome-binding GTPase [Candidatus Methanomethyliaceae archaeon]|nr:50S ribosome-binding GTPase [Candidatus Methanomethyliaceae archaeon]MCX8169631.1 50S ribosome-binding GTPase [Candidatus Methanomethyliaceae archaeon]MDW7971024.1 GTPase [Nitrososphaerota archaeon]
MKQPFEDIPTIIMAEELIEKSIREAKRMELSFPRNASAIVKARRREISRINAMANTSAKYLEKIVKSFPNIDSLHPFYREMLEIIGGTSNIRAILGRINRASRIIREIASSSIFELKKIENPIEANKIRRAFIGRMASIIRDLSQDLEKLSEVRNKLKDVPSIDPNIPIVILAGYPGVGKSTIVGALSSAKPEVRSYPFTTKEVIVGHIKIDEKIIQIVDTPGLLDRPIEKRSKEELMAISALNYLKGLIAFIVDTSESNGFTLEEQRALFESLSKFLTSKIIIFFNKVDISSEEQILKAESIFGLCIKMAAAKGIGLEKFLESIKNALM